MVGGTENAANALQLDAHVVDETLPQRLLTDGAVTGNGAATLVANEDNLSVFFQVQGHGAVFTTYDVNAVRLLTAVVGIIGKHQSAYGELGALEMLHPEKGIARQFKQPQTQLGVPLIGKIAPRG